MLPQEFIDGLTISSREYFAARAGPRKEITSSYICIILWYGESYPLSGLFHLEVNKHGLDTYNFIMKGTAFQAKFPVGNFLGLEVTENVDDEYVVTLNMNPPEIDFSGSRLVTK